MGLDFARVGFIELEVKDEGRYRRLWRQFRTLLRIPTSLDWPDSNYRITFQRVEHVVQVDRRVDVRGDELKPVAGLQRRVRRYGDHRVVVLSDGLWRSRFGAQARLDGQTLKLNGEVFTVIGVMPRGFQFPDQNVMFWAPLAVAGEGRLSTVPRTQKACSNGSPSFP